MTLEMEDLVRQAQRRQAERAADPDRIRAAMPARAARLARRRRNGTVLAFAAAVAVAAAVVVPIALLGRGPVSVQPAAPGLNSVPAPSGLSAPLRYRPTWLPPGVAERSRVAALADLGPGHIDGAYRVYTTKPADHAGNTAWPGLTVQVRKATGVNDPDGGTPVTVNGKPGRFHGDLKADAKSYVEWRADADWVVSIQQTNLGLAQADLLRIANSVEPDPGSLDIPLRFGWLPDGLSAQWVAFTGNGPNDWHLTVSGEQPQSGTKETGKENRGITVELGPTTTAPDGGTPVRVGGRNGRIVTRSVEGATFPYVVVDLGGGRVLTVGGQGGVSSEDLVKVAEHTEVTGDPDLTWLGK